MKTLVVYYSAQNHTKEIAKKLSEYLNADEFEIEPEDKYTDEDLDWTNDNARVTREYHDESLRNIKLKKVVPDNFNTYDKVVIMYPIWWGIAAWPVDTFVKENDFTNKEVIPVATSYSSGLGNSANLLEKESNGGNFKNAKRFFQDPSDEEIKEFAETL